MLYSSALRRLAGVTQVAATAEGHAYHNRLTHSLEVSQLARRIAERLILTTAPTDLDAVGGLDPDTAEAAALAHDLGHPPFGHVGESELNRLVLDVKGADGFEGNAQSFRIVTTLAMRTIEPAGLDLTRATLNGILKYPWPRGTSGYESKKFGYYASERSAFEFAREGEASGSRLRSLEAEIMDRADDVAYAVHDIYDFYRTGFIPLHVLAHNETEWERFVKAVEATWDERSKPYDHDQLMGLRKELLSPYLPDYPFGGTTAHRGQLRAWATALITHFVELGAFDVTPAWNGVGARVTLDPGRAAWIDLLKEMTRYFVIRNSATQTVQFGQRQVIRGLFRTFMNDRSFDTADDGARTAPYPPGLEEAILAIRDETTLGEERDLLKARAVADAIAAMTEDQAFSLHRRLSGQSVGSMFDPIVY